MDKPDIAHFVMRAAAYLESAGTASWSTASGGTAPGPVQVAGSALTMDAWRFRDALRESPRLRTTCQAYVRAFLGQVLQTIACHNVHTLEQRCARSVLVIHDRSSGDTLALRQEFLAQTLGERRSTAAAVARTLEMAGLIRYCHGDIRVVDRAGLELAACECYGIDRERYRRLLPGALAGRDRARSGSKACAGRFAAARLALRRAGSGDFPCAG
jgi:hypothetical protein